MNTEWNDTAERRAAVHGALADPTRVRVVDLLTVGDAAASELSARLGTPSNLLAHHLGILAGAGVIERRRSEGDGRRAYWRLVPDAFAALAAPARIAPARVVFVCTGNSARSPLAAALWREASPIPATSAGTHPAPRLDPGTVDAARRHGLDLAGATPRPLAEVIGEAAGEHDLVVTVCDRAHEELGSTPAVHWSVPDPVPAGTRDSFDRAYDELATRVRLLTPLLHAAS
ncbi:helix-turn-helix domain-containing protein [Nocardioides sp. YIM 152588]|uniref:arsenate reductase/protein-tyrosine-phosphatase family protein n=1 Tax=Nocardioides sp. YIM 152588 TaxID=3158259 RepID=UPI0032E4FECA